MRRALTSAEKLDWLQLCRCGGVGPVGFTKLLGRFGSARRALQELPRLAREAGAERRLRPCPRAEAEAELEAIARRGWHLVALGEPDYPELLEALPDAPPLITVRGSPAVLTGPGVGVVGARNASANGRVFAKRLAAELAARGLVVVSGLARGIDTAAHEGALEPERGATVAVIASGVDVPYPPENADLMERIAAAEGGAVISERPLGSEPQARHFPKRNRLIAGLSRGVVVVEAAPGSGSLITARLAAEQGREVMAVPGSPLDPRHRGTNQLLREGAALIEDAEDVVALLEPILLAARRPQPPPRRTAPARPSAGAAAGVAPPPPSAPPGGPPPGLPPEERSDRGGGLAALIRERLGPEPLAVDELIRQCHASPAEVQDALLELELEGRLERHPGNRVSLVTG